MTVLKAPILIEYTTRRDDDSGKNLSTNGILESFPHLHKIQFINFFYYILLVTHTCTT
jgi:hypothetical protein